MNAPVKAWLDANAVPQPGSGRDPFRVPAELATQHTDPSVLDDKAAESQGLFELLPTVAAQELDTRATTGVIYWEGSQVVTATRDGQPLAGEAYVELTGYAPCC